MLRNKGLLEIDYSLKAMLDITQGVGLPLGQTTTCFLGLAVSSILREEEVLTALDSNGSEVNFVRDLNLNVTLSNTSVVEEHLATLPWLFKTKSACNSEVANGKCNPKSNDAVPSSNIKEEAGTSVQNLMWLESLKSCSCSSKPETEKVNANSYRDESDAERDKVHQVRMLDINEPLLDEDQLTEEQTGTKV